MLIVAYPRGVSTGVAQVLLNRLAEVLGGVFAGYSQGSACVEDVGQARQDIQGRGGSDRPRQGLRQELRGAQGLREHPQAQTPQGERGSGLGDRHKLVGYAVAAILAFAAIAVMAAGLLWGKKRKKVEAAEGEGVE